MYYYLLEGSTDIYRFATTQNKNHWWENLRRAQTERIEENVFSDAISDDLIASLAADPDATLKQLHARKRETELANEFYQFQKLLVKMMPYLEPSKRAISLDILQGFEAKLTKLNWVPQDIVAEGLARAMAFAEIQAERMAKRPNAKWNTFVDNLHGLAADTQHYMPLKLKDLFQLSLDDNEQVMLAQTWEKLFGEQTQPKTPSTFGFTNQSKAEVGADRTVGGLEIVRLDECQPNPTAAEQKQKPRVEPHQPGRLVQLCLFEIAATKPPAKRAKQKPRKTLPKKATSIPKQLPLFELETPVEPVQGEQLLLFA
jgi:hypothetical protein